MAPVLPPNSTPRARRGVLGADTAVADDVALMTYLVSAGRVAKPENEQWHDELLRLVAQARRNLARSEGTFVMGHTHVRLFRVTRDDVISAAGSGSRHRTGVVEPDDPPTVPFAVSAHHVLASHPEFTPRSSIPRGRMPTPADLEPLPSEIRQPIPKVKTIPTTPSRVVLAAASALLVAAVGTVLIAAWTPESEPVTQNVAATHSQVPALAIPTTEVTAKAQDVSMARRPAASYVAPPPKITPKATVPDTSTRRKTSAPKRQHRRTLPNPIPGLPPIRLP
ncbi:hypothetical protein HH308_15120 [Gordonia sp. TBRC 11910]|uniref:Uncharacterized protein n=1 Tax=Gordonia asplenii TaxID=2725283 RepID=A0A848KUI3_9ACTN|nr:hypothetical protein [Gordonia asplenii]NMO02544.1 hypothetical protein [Gordonia asplenii]